MTVRLGNFNAPATEAEAVVNDVPFSQPSRFLYVGAAGDLTVVMADGFKNTVLFKAVPVGTVLNVSATMVTAAGTVATDVVAMY